MGRATEKHADVSSRCDMSGVSGVNSMEDWAACSGSLDADAAGRLPSIVTSPARFSSRSASQTCVAERKNFDSRMDWAERASRSVFPLDEPPNPMSSGNCMPLWNGS